MRKNVHSSIEENVSDTYFPLLSVTYSSFCLSINSCMVVSKGYTECCYPSVNVVYNLHYVA